MIEPRYETQTASDGYAIHLTTWPAAETLRGRVVILHGVQSHGGWYHNLGRTLAEAGYETVFPDRRGSGANQVDRGHTPSARRLVTDVTELLTMLRSRSPSVSMALGGISWGGKLAVLAAAEAPNDVGGLALICPGLHPRVGVSMSERVRIAWAFLTNRRKTFPIPLSDPALFTAYPEGQAFIGADPLGLRYATAGLLAASVIIDRHVARAPRCIQQPTLLMLAGQDRIVDNARTLNYISRLATKEFNLIQYPEGHHTLEFEPNPGRYARDFIGWLDVTLNRPEDRR
jgi:alpha-beta hydrolase superfamily lysophospholipase